MKTFNITVSGCDQGDIEIAVEEVLKLIRRGNLSGANENDTGGFSFDSEGEYEDFAQRMVLLCEEKNLSAAAIAAEFKIDADRLNNGGVAEVIRILLEDDEEEFIESRIEKLPGST